MRKASITIILLVLFSVIGVSQQLPHYSQYMFNPFLINPAVAGTMKNTQAQIGFRGQWVGFNDAPQTGIASCQGLIVDNLGVGGILFRDKTGPISRTGMLLSCAYHIQVNKDAYLSFGLEGIMYQHVLNYDELTLDLPNDQLVTSGLRKDMLYDSNSGIYLYSDKYFAGISISQMIQSKIDMSEINSGLNKLARHYFFHFGYRLEVNEEFDIEPSVLYKAIASAPSQIDINTKVIYKKLIWLGLSYRQKESAVLMLGLQKDKYLIGYSYDITLSNIRKYSSGSHEIMLGMNIMSDHGKHTKSSIE